MAEDKKADFHGNLLDATNDLEQIPIGASEAERNEARLKAMIEGTNRPASHVTKEVAAWLGSNVIIPLITGGVVNGVSRKLSERAIRKAGVAAGKLLAGAKNLPKEENMVRGLKSLTTNPDSKWLLKSSKDVVQETKNTAKATKEATKKTVKTVQEDADALGDFEKGFKKGKFVPADEKKVQAQKDAVFKEGKEAVDSLNRVKKLYSGHDQETLKELQRKYNLFADKYRGNPKYQNYSLDDIEELVFNDPSFQGELNNLGITDLYRRSDRTAAKAGIEAAAGYSLIPKVVAVSKDLREIANSNNDYEFEGPRPYDPSIEEGFFDKAENFAKDMLDLNNMDPDKYPMEKINQILTVFNDNGKNPYGRYWNPKQIERLSDTAKVKLVNAIAKGKYDTTSDNASWRLRQVYNYVTNNKETK